MNKQSKPFIALLLTLALGIWGAVIYQLGQSAEPIETISHQYQPHELGNKTRLNTDSLFESSLIEVRNPFRPFREKIKPRKAKPAVRITEVKPPSVRYLGYLEDQAGGLALMELPNGETHIAQIGEQVQGIHIRSISKENLKVHFKEKVFDIALSR